MDAGVLVPLGVFATLVAGWYLQTRTNIAYLDALSRERVAAIEKGLPLPGKEAEPPKLPERSSHPLKPTLAVLAVGIALWVPRVGPPRLGHGTPASESSGWFGSGSISDE